MKKIVDILLTAKQQARLINWLERSFVLSIDPVVGFGLFKNGTLIPGSEMETYLPTGLMNHPERDQLSGQAIVSVNPGDIIELRCTGIGVELKGSDVNAARASMNVIKLL